MPSHQGKASNIWLETLPPFSPSTHSLTSAEHGALPADYQELGTHVLASLLDGQAPFLVNIDDGDSGMQTAPSCNCGHHRAGQHCKGTLVREGWHKYHLQIQQVEQ